MKRILKSLLCLCVLFGSVAYAEDPVIYSFADMFNITEGSVFGYRTEYYSTFDIGGDVSNVQILEWRKAPEAEGIPEGSYAMVQTTASSLEYRYFTMAGNLQYWGSDMYAVAENASSLEYRERFEYGGSITFMPASIAPETEFTETKNLIETDYDDDTEKMVSYTTTFSVFYDDFARQTAIGDISGSYFITGSIKQDQRTVMYTTFFHPIFAWLTYSDGFQDKNYTSVRSKRLKGAYIDGVAYPQNSAGGLVDMRSIMVNKGEAVDIHASIFGDQDVDVYFVFQGVDGRLQSLAGSGTLEDGVVPYVKNVSLTQLMPLRPFNLKVGSVTFDETWTDGWLTLYMVVCPPGGLLTGKVYSVDSMQFHLGNIILG